MARYQVILAYDGTEFCGFQRQPTGSAGRSVQAVVEAALAGIGWQGRSILAAGRTDAGVHASGQVIAFDLEWSHPAEALQAALNANLPPDVAARGVKLAPPDFHPRYDAVRRSYRYRLFCAGQRDPLRERYAWRVWPAVDAAKLHAAAAALLGSHDFAAFGTPPRPGGVTLREIFRAEWTVEPPDGWAFEITGNAFLFHMVRRLVGLQTAAAQGRLAVDAVAKALAEPFGPRVRTKAPPHGLTLIAVEYGGDEPEAGSAA